MSVEIDNVLDNLHVMNEVFRQENMNCDYKNIFSRLRKANSALLLDSEEKPIKFKESSEYNFFPLFYIKKESFF